METKCFIGAKNPTNLGTTKINERTKDNFSACQKKVFNGHKFSLRSLSLVFTQGLMCTIRQKNRMDTKNEFALLRTKNRMCWPFLFFFFIKKSMQKKNEVVKKIINETAFNLCGKYFIIFLFLKTIFLNILINIYHKNKT